MNEMELKKGSVLAIPVDNASWAIGQVIEPGISFFLGVIPSRFSAPLNSDLIGSEKMKIFSWTNDAEVFRGNWKFLGTERVLFDPNGLEYLVGVNGKMMVESFDGSTHREYDANSDHALSYRKARSPLIVQDAVQAALGIGEWKTTYNQMIINTI